MRSPKNIVILILLLTTVGGAITSWRQYEELVTLRALALQQPAVQITAQAPADPRPAIPTPASDTVAAETTVENRGSSQVGDRGRGMDRAPGERPRNGYLQVMEQPEVQRLMTLQRKAELDSRYAALFRELNLRPDQLDAFKNLLVDKSNALMDVRAAAREQGVDPRTDRETYQKLISNAQAQVDDSIRAQLGEAGYAQYKNYEATQPQRALVDQLQQRLSYSSTPLTQAQSAQLVQLLASASAASTANAGTAFAGPGGPGRTARVTVSDAAINQALGVLAGPQVDALRQIQQEQQLQAQLGAAMRAQFQNRGQPSGSTPAGGVMPAPATRPGGG